MFCVQSSELSFKKGDRILVEGQYDKDWWKGSLGDDVGFFPANFVAGLERIQLQEDEEEERDGKHWQDSEYFDSYATLVIHHQMLSDRARTQAYKQAVERLRPLIEGK